MAKAIVREPEAVRPWERTPLRPPAPKANSSVLADLTSDLLAEEAPEAALAPADAILERARQDAVQLLEQARREADQLRAAAAQAGFADGQARALDEWAEERRSLRELLERTGEAYRSFCLAQVPELAVLVTEAAEKLLYEQLTLEPQRVLAVVRQALEHVHAAVTLIVHLNPDDVEMVRTDLITRDPRRRPPVQLAPDPTVERGGCWIESEHGEVDATLGSRIARLKAAVDG